MAATFDPGIELGPRLRRVREERGLSARELARRLTCSPSLISQIERGLSAPSVGMLYALATELRTSIDFLFGVATPVDGRTVTVHGDGFAHGEPGPESIGPESTGPESIGPESTGPESTGPAGISTAGVARNGSTAPATLPPGHGIVQRGGSRRTIDLASGVRWERLTPGPDSRVDFLEVIYSPSGHSTDSRRPLRHDGQEYGIIISGTLQASVGFETFELGPGDSIAFDSSFPHEYWNTTAHDVHAIWAVVHAQPGRA